MYGHRSTKSVIYFPKISPPSQSYSWGKVLATKRWAKGHMELGEVWGMDCVLRLNPEMSEGVDQLTLGKTSCVSGIGLSTL